MLSMEAVITTATDLNQKWAVDIFAKKNRLYIEDMKLAKLVSADILAGKQVLAEIEPECSVIGQIPKELKFIHESDRLSLIHIYSRTRSKFEVYYALNVLFFEKQSFICYNKKAMEI